MPSEDRIETCRKLLVIVSDQEPDVGLAIGQLPHDLSGLLGAPGSVRVGGATREMDAAAANLDEHEHIDRLQEHRFDSEKIAGQQLLLIVGHQMMPTG